MPSRIEITALLLFTGWAQPQLSAGAAASAATQPEAEAVDSVGERCNLFISQLKNGDFAAAETLFAAKVKAALPEAKLAQVWKQLEAVSGPLKTWKIEGRTAVGPNERCEIALTFERNEQKGQVVIVPQSHEVTGLWFGPPTPRELSSGKPWPCAQSTSFHCEDVTVGRQPFVLGATVTAPTGPGPFPGVVLVAGSGPHDRDETIGPNKPFKDIAEGLAAHNIVVLRYDKRTFTYGTKMDPKATTVEEEVIADAVAAVDLVRKRVEVDRHRVFVVGHSLGALLAPEIAKRAGDVTGIVMMAASGRRLPAVVVEQMRYLGTPPAQLADAEKAANAWMQGSLPADATFLGAPVRYWTDLDKRNEVQLVKELKKPVLYVRGERDYQVTAEDEMAWKKGLAGVSQVEFATFPALNHLFIAGSGKSGPAEYQTPGHVDPSVLATLVSFVNEARH